MMLSHTTIIDRFTSRPVCESQPGQQPLGCEHPEAADLACPQAVVVGRVSPGDAESAQLRRRRVAESQINISNLIILL